MVSGIRTSRFVASETSARLPPQIAQGFAECVDVTLAHTTIVVPLLKKRGASAGQALAAVILERFCDIIAPAQDVDLDGQKCNIPAVGSLMNVSDELHHLVVVYDSTFKYRQSFANKEFCGGFFRTRHCSFTELALYVRTSISKSQFNR